MDDELATMFGGFSLLAIIIGTIILLTVALTTTHTQKMASLGYCEYQSTGTSSTVWKKCDNK